MTGSTPFSIEASDNFKRSFKKLAKIHRDSFVAVIGKTLEDLIDDQYPTTLVMNLYPEKLSYRKTGHFINWKSGLQKGLRGKLD